MTYADNTANAQSGLRWIGGRDAFASLSREILDHLLEGCQIVSRDWLYLYVNEAAAAQMQRRPAELVGSSLLEAFPSLEHSPTLDWLQRCRDSGIPSHTHAEWPRPDGTPRRVALTFLPVPEGTCILSLDIAGAPDGAAAAESERSSSREARERRDAREQSLLAEAGALLSATLDFDDTCANIADLAVRGCADFCFLEVLDEGDCPRRLQVTARDPAASDLARALRQLPLDLRKPHLGFTALHSGLLRLSNQISHDYLALLAQNAAHLRALVAMAPQALLELPLQARGRRVGAMILVRSTGGSAFDAQDVMLGQELARRAALAIDNARLYRQAQAAIRNRDDMLSMIAHDLRNPLNAMLLQLRLFERVGEEPERRSQTQLHAVLREGARLDRMIEDLLDVARIEAGTLSVHACEFSAAEVAGEVVETSRPLAEQAQLTLALQVEPELPRLVGDRLRIYQALGNLVGNAIKFTPAGGHVLVQVTRTSEETVFCVRDTGPGIPVEQQERLFDRFWQAQRIDRRGAGLGLSIAKAIVEAHGGRLWLAAAAESGSTFAFALP